MTRGVSIIIEKDKKFLFMKEVNGPFTGYWAMPKGVVLDGETPKDTVVRKAKSEINLDVLPLEKIFEGKASTKVDIVEFWTTKVIGGDLKINPMDGSDHEWLSVEDALGKKLIPATQKFLEEKRRNDKK